MQLLCDSSNDSSERLDKRRRTCNCSGEKQLDMEVSGVKLSFVMCAAGAPQNACVTAACARCSDTSEKWSQWS